MSFRYFAYGSNLWPPQLRGRCPSATPLRTGVLKDWSVTYDKPSRDGSAKLNIRPQPGARVHGVVYEVEDGERQYLDEAEPLYTPVDVEVDGERLLSYSYEGEPYHALPYDWYVETSVLGAASHGLPTKGLEVETEPDPLAPGIRPATLADLAIVQDILRDGLSGESLRYFAHPGDYAWWVYHDDPRHPDHFSTWLQDDKGVLVVDSLDPSEINVFTRPGVDRMPLVRWAQRRLGDRGEVGWVADEDTEFIDALRADGYSAGAVYRSYRWDLVGSIPEPRLPEGWNLRSIMGEAEANSRRAASHAAFDSTMPSAMHLQRYVDFMRSEVYESERDLVAVSPDGTIAAFMVWWPDDSGIAQIEPFGTHPDFHRRGIGRALIHHGLRRMKEAGMHTCRVLTDDWRDATNFYEAVGFTDVGRVRWWERS